MTVAQAGRRFKRTVLLPSNWEIRNFASNKQRTRSPLRSSFLAAAIDPGVHNASGPKLRRRCIGWWYPGRCEAA
jgi:hypothetical protein